METEKDKLKCMIPISAPSLDEIFKNKREADKARAVLQYLFFIRMRMKKDPNFAPGVDRSTGFVPFSSENIKQIVRNYSQIIQQLVEHNIVEYCVNENGNKSYMPGRYTMLYRVVNTTVAPNKKKYRQEYISHKTVIEAVRRYHLRRYMRQTEKAVFADPWLSSTLEFIDRLYLDVSSDQIDELACDDNIDVDYLDAYATLFNNKLRRFFIRDSFGRRLHTHVVNIPSVLRPFLKLIDDDCPLVLMDIKSAQPYLLSAIFYRPELIELIPEFAPILPIIMKYRNCYSIRLFHEDCTSGTFYEGLAMASGKSKKEVKALLFAHVFFSSLFNYNDDEDKGSERWHTQQLFNTKYRDVFCLITELKRTHKSVLTDVPELTKSYSLPTIIAQRLESTILIDGIVRNCAEEDIPLATIHDAFIIKTTDQQKFMNVFKAEFNRLGLKPPQIETTLLSVQH